MRTSSTILSLAILIAAGCGGCLLDPLPSAPPNRDPAGSREPPATARGERGDPGERGQLERDIAQEVDSYRRSRRLPGLSYHPVLAQAAGEHARAMARRGDIDHLGYDQRQQQVAAVLPLRGFGENVAFTTRDSGVAKRMVERWVASPGHRRNLEGSWQLTGVGAARDRHGSWYVAMLYATVER